MTGSGRRGASGPEGETGNGRREPSAPEETASERQAPSGPEVVTESGRSVLYEAGREKRQRGSECGLRGPCGPAAGTGVQLQEPSAGTESERLLVLEGTGI